MRKISHVSHGLGDHAVGHTGSNVATNGAPKKLTAIAVHSGMSDLQKAGAGVGGLGHPTTVISGGQPVASSSPAQPLAHAYGDGVLKTRGPAPISFGQRSRGPTPDSTMHSLGRAILDEALRGK